MDSVDNIPEKLQLIPAEIWVGKNVETSEGHTYGIRKLAFLKIWVYKDYINNSNLFKLYYHSTDAEEIIAFNGNDLEILLDNMKDWLLTQKTIPIKFESEINKNREE